MPNIEEACKIKGWLTPSEMSFLAMHAKKCNTVVEVGSYYGRSARCILDNSNVVLYCVDPWNGPILDNRDKQVGNVNDYVYQQFLNNMNGYYETGRVKPFRGILKNFIVPEEIDMIFIDGDHRYEYVKDDIQLALGMVKQNGLICGHDYNPVWLGVIQAVNETFGSDVRIHDSIWWVINE